MLDVYTRFRRNSFQIVENFQFVTILYFGWFDNNRWVLSLDDAHLAFLFLLFSFRFDVKIDWKMASFSFEFYNRNDVNVASITCKNMYFSRNFKAEATQLWHIFLLFFLINTNVSLALNDLCIIIWYGGNSSEVRFTHNQFLLKANLRPNTASFWCCCSHI